MNTEQLIHDTGRVPLIARLLISPFGLGALFASSLAWRESFFSSLFCAVFGISLLSVWFLRTRLFYDTTRREIVFRGPANFIPRRVPLAGAAAVRLHDVRMLTRSVSGTDVSIRYQDGGERWLTRVPAGDPQHLANVISQAAALPITNDEAA